MVIVQQKAIQFLGLSTQKTFKLHILSLVEAIKDMGNPFLDQSGELNHFDQSGELLALDTGNVLNDSVVETVRTIEELGKEQFKSFYKSVLVDYTRSIHEPIKKNSLSLFKAQSPNQKRSNQRLLKV